MLLLYITGTKAQTYADLIALGGKYVKRLMIDLDAEGFPDYAEHVLLNYDPIPRPPEHAETLHAKILNAPMRSYSFAN